MKYDRKIGKEAVTFVEHIMVDARSIVIDMANSANTRDRRFDDIDSHTIKVAAMLLDAYILATERRRWPIMARACNMNAVTDLWCAFDCLSRGVGLGPMTPREEEDE